MMKRVLGVAGVGVLVASIGALAACGDSEATDENAASSVAALQSANVSITLHDESGAKIGEGSGVLIAPNLVLTSAHLVAGKAKWTVTTADGTKSALGTRGLTYDWMQYDSMKAHPRKHDVAVIYLSKPIQLAAYPKLATKKQSAGTSAQRVRHGSGSFEMVGATLSTMRNFPHAYTTEMPTSETLDTGGAVINGKGEIVGVVTGRGMQTSKLYVARTDGLTRWLSPKISCAGGKSPSSTSIRTYGAPPPKPGCEKDGGGSSGSSGSSGYGSSGSSGGGYGGNGGGDDGSSGSAGSSGSGGGGTCDDGGGNCNGDCSTGNPGGSNNGGSDGTPGGGDGDTGGGGGGDGDNGSSGSSGSNTGGSDGTPGGGGGSGDGDNGSSGSSGSNTGGSDGTPGGGGGGGSGSGDEEVCEGPTDNPEECPPEPTGCVGPNCGGAKTPDSTIDYGNCNCSSGGGGGTIPPLR